MEDVVYIPISRNEYAVIDAVDYPLVGQFSWYSSGNGYAKATLWVQGKPHHIKMHRLIMMASEIQLVEHADNNRLNNRRYNLRIATQSQNMMNVGIRADNTSGHKGVSYHKASGKWTARISLDKGHKHLGLYDTADEAAAVYNIAAKKYFREFAKLNNVPDDVVVDEYQKPVKRVSYKGVIYEDKKRTYRARISVNGKRISLGRYKTAEEAAGAYNEASWKLFGDKSKLNNII